MTANLLMVVEDDSELRETICELLLDESYRVVSRPNGYEAFEYLESEEERPDLILLDLMMPRMNGWEFRSKQVATPALADIPVIVLTAGRRFDREKLGEVTILQKPLRLEALLSEIAEHIEKGAYTRNGEVDG